MDLYLINGQDGISLPEMIDWDIKLSNSDTGEEIGANNLMGLGYDLPSLEIEDDPNSLWMQSYSANSNSSFELDFLGDNGSTLMVKPSSVIPFVTTRNKVDNETEISENESSRSIKSEGNETFDEHALVKTEPDINDEYLLNDDDSIKDSETNIETREDAKEETEKFNPNSNQIQDVVSLQSVPVEFVDVPLQKYVEILPQKKCLPQKRQVVSSIEHVKVYPKPAYSYSCLIAMALKNSQTGSLPVSEIYSFMCHHFPYFKTAPNGWKNSVRHNLSLNKCFEKIEKAPGSGAANGSHRKGCLWAMNPLKITKMDDEVAKWSKKDPSAIKKAMVCPENLELLERGELKDEAAYIEVEDDEVKDEELDEDDFGVEIEEDERISPIDDDSDDEISKIPPSLQPFEPKFAQFNTHRVIRKTSDISERSINLNSLMDFEMSDVISDDIDVVDSGRTMLAFDESTPIYAVDPLDENMLIELPLIKRPRVQSNYICQPVLNVKRHNITGLRSIKLESP